MAAVMIVLLLRGQVARVVDLADKVKYKDFEISFARDVSKIKEAISSSLPDIKRTSVEVQKKAEGLYSTASLSPAAAIMEAWREVEASASNLILSRQPNLKFDSDTPYKHIEKLLSEQSMVNSSHIKIFHELRVLRNKVAHVEQYEIIAEQAIEYVNLALTLAEYLASKSVLSGN